MKQLKEQFAAKVVAFILILICAVLMVFSAIVIAVNMNLGWYHKSNEAIEADIYETAASCVFDEMTDSLNYMSGNFEEVTASGRIIICYPDDTELIEGESRITENFGYKITSKDRDYVFGTKEKNSKSRALNENLKNREGIYTESFHYDFFDIEVYLGELTRDSLPVSIYNECKTQQTIYKYRYAAIITCVVSFVVALCLFIFLMVSIGKNRKDRKSILDRIPVEICFCAGILVIGAMASIAGNLYLDIYRNIEMVEMLIIAGIILTVADVLGVICILAFKLRRHTLWKSSLLCLLTKLIKLIGKGFYRFINCIPLIWKSAVVLTICILINLFILLYAADGYGLAILMWFVGAILTMAAGLYIALCLRKLHMAAQRLADGDMETAIDKKGLFLDLAQHADTLNSIGDGLSKAVEEKMKSERMKTELITNVSHDIKTPLTSIINYVDFLKKEGIDDEESREYIDVLDKQSQRLRKLIEDLMEASKAATGNIKLNMDICDIAVMMSQVMGEYEEKAEKADLKLIFKTPEDSTKIMADGRRLWRVFDNLLNNICKYSQPGTRVYQILEKNGDKVIVTYKNISNYELGISSDELTERFVRGDSSRHTEGSGLGLSIAKNLTELQGGIFDIDIDGDLFKVVMKFDAI